MNLYEPCSPCSEDRAAGNLDAAITCRSCDGKGIRRNPASYLCNKCGGSMSPSPSSDDTSPHGLVETTVSGGYSSHHLFDTTNYTFSVCEKCLREFFNQCAIPPAVSCYMGGTGEETYASDRAYWERRVWVDAGGDVEKLKQGLCNVTIECPETASWRQFSSGHLTEVAMCDAHKLDRAYANSYEAEIGMLTGIPLEREKRSPEEKKRVVWAWFRAAVRPGTTVAYFRFAPECVYDLVDQADFKGQQREDSFGAIWFVGAVTPPDWAIGRLYAFPNGLLLVGPYYDIRGMAGANSVGEAPILNHLPERPSEEDE